MQELPRDAKTAIARSSDQLNNIGCDFSDENDYDNAIKYYNMALQVMPINDDALKNLVVCYKKNYWRPTKPF